MIQVSKSDNNLPSSEPWGSTLDKTQVYIEQVITYWSQILKSVERNYSPTKREALALKEGLIKFKPYIEGETILAITVSTMLLYNGVRLSRT